MEEQQVELVEAELVGALVEGVQRGVVAVVGDSDQPPNDTRYLFRDDRGRDFYVDWERDAHHVVSALRLLAGRGPSAPVLMALVGELATHSPEFRIWWAGHTVTVHVAGTITIRHPVVGELTVAYETLALGSAPGVRIVTYLADSGTPSADALALLRSWIAPTGPSLEAENSSPLSPPTSSGL